MGKCAGTVALSLAVFFAFHWTCLICCPQGWHTKSTLIWNFHVGLYKVRVEPAIAANLAGGVAKAADYVVGSVSSSKKRKRKPSFFADAVSFVTEGEETLRYYRDLFCTTASIVAQNCAPWEMLLWASWMLIICTIISNILLLIGAGMQYYYWFHSARKIYRKWSSGLWVAASFTNLIGLAAYTGLTFQFGQWLAEMMITSARSTFSFIYVLAVVSHLFTWAPCLIAWTCIRPNEQEEMAEQLALEKKALRWGLDDEYDDELLETQYDEYGEPVMPHDQYGYPIAPDSRYHVSAYVDHTGADHTGTYHDPASGAYVQQLAPGYYADPYATGQPQGSGYTEAPLGYGYGQQ